MVLKNGEVESKQYSNSTPSYSPTSSSYSSKSNKYTLSLSKRDLLVVRKMFGHVHKDMDGIQRENIFQTRCLINHKVCVLIIDGGRCINVASKRLVEEFNLPIVPYPRPYKLQWFSQDG